MQHDDFLASHILKLPDSNNSGAKSGLPRDIQTKAKQFNTLNGRSVIVKDHSVYTNQGFKTLIQAQIVSDVVYLASTHDNRRWQVYYIARPLLGVFAPDSIIPASVARAEAERDNEASAVANTPHPDTPNPQARVALKAVKAALLEYPMIARQLGTGSATIVQRYSENYVRPDQPQPPRPQSLRSRRSSVSLQGSIDSLKLSISDQSTRIGAVLSPEEGAMGVALEGAVFAALNALDYLDKHQLHILLSAAGGDRSVLDSALERYVTEQLHEDVLFPRLCSIHRREDSSLTSRLKKMVNIDIAQVGIPIEGGQAGKRQLALRVDNAVALFKKLGDATSPQHMTEILLATIRAVTTGSSDAVPDSSNDAEKQSLAMTINADSLVSMLLLIVIKSNARAIYASLSYMRSFAILADVELGEIGYALSTLEAVLSYLDTDSDHLRRASRTNLRLWSAVKKGDVSTVRGMLQPGSGDDEPQALDEDSPVDDASLGPRSAGGEPLPRFPADGGTLSHVFPFQRPPTPPPEPFRRKGKRVSMAEIPSRSTSSSSARTHSRRPSGASNTSVRSTEDTTSVKLAQTQNQNGDSILMMAIESSRFDSLKYLLELEEHFPPDMVLQDVNLLGATLLNAALQMGDSRIIDLVLDYARRHLTTDRDLTSYLSQQDSRGRCAAHFLGVHDALIPLIGQDISWTIKDKSGQTPLTALCRTYDLAEYVQTINQALDLAIAHQGDGQLLHGEDHVDVKGNTLLHIVSNATIAARLLVDVDLDVNAVNDRKFTPLMSASKYGKHGVISLLLNDPRVDLDARDLRGLSATELAKDDSSRRRLDHMVMLSRRQSNPNDQTPTIVRSIFIDNGTFRMVLEAISSAPGETPVPVSCRRSLYEFQDLLGWLTLEHPASWIPSCGIRDILSPFAHPAKPSRAVLMDAQQRLDRVLKLLLTHATFSTHELVWEFFLVPDLSPAQLAERTHRKAELRMEKIREDTEPLSDVTEVEMFVQHAQDQTRRLLDVNRKLLRSTDRQINRLNDIAELARSSSSALDTLDFLPDAHKAAYAAFVNALQPSSPEARPLWSFHYDVDAIVNATAAVSAALLRPTHLIQRIKASRRETHKTLGSLERSSRWTPKLSVFDDTRRALLDEARQEAESAREKQEFLAAELRHAQQVVAAELAGWHEARARIGRDALRDLARRSVVREKDRLAALKRAVRRLGT